MKHKSTQQSRDMSLAVIALVKEDNITRSNVHVYKGPQTVKKKKTADGSVPL